MWVAADVDGVINEVFGSFSDADEYFRTMSHRGEFLWDVTESYERMVGGIPARKPDPTITPERAKASFYPVEPMPGETPAEAGNLPQFTPMGRPVTPAVLPDAALRYGLPGGVESRRLPDPNRPHRRGGRIFSIPDHGDVISGGPETIFASTSVSHLRSQPEFDQAKNHGDFRAAAMLVDRLVKPSVIEDVRNSLDPRRPVVIIPVLAQEGTSMNSLPVAMAERLGEELSAEVWTHLYKLSSVHNTDASANDRARTVHSWSGQAPPRGAQIVLVDDTYTSGQTLVSMAAHIGHPPSAVVTISSGRYGKRWKADPAQVAALLDKAGIKEEDFYEIYGSTVQKALTGAQIHQYRLNGRAGRSGLLERFPAGTGEGGTGANQGNASQGSASERQVNEDRIHSLSDSVGRQQSRAAQSLANLEATFRASFFAGDFDGSAAAMDSADLDTFEAFARKLVRLASAGNPDAAGMLEWVKHVNAGTRPQVEADPEFDALLRAMRSRFPNRRRGRAMMDHRQQHFTTDSFDRAFAQHVANGDFQAAYEAVRDSEDAVRIPVLRKWMKEARKGDAVAQKNLEWISAIFNGTLPSGVTQQPTTGGSTAAGSATPPPRSQRQAPPPPPPPVAPQTPPPRPDGVEKLNIPALVFLARKMGATPSVRRFGARGSFTPSNKRGERQNNPTIKVNEFLAKEDWQGAARTLAHEIGHFEPPPTPGLRMEGSGRVEKANP